MKFSIALLILVFQLFLKNWGVSRKDRFFQSIDVNFEKLAPKFVKHHEKKRFSWWVENKIEGAHAWKFWVLVEKSSSQRHSKWLSEFLTSLSQMFALDSNFWCWEHVSSIRHNVWIFWPLSYQWIMYDFSEISWKSRCRISRNTYNVFELPWVLCSKKNFQKLFFYILDPQNRKKPKVCAARSFKWLKRTLFLSLWWRS